MVVCRLSFIKRTLSTVDASELYKFKKLGTKWAHDNEEFRLLRLMNPLRIDYICRHYGRDLRNTRILDVGTGGGLLALVTLFASALLTCSLWLVWEPK
jgi:2-polyprenyl-6-hydroxyphenyl methylase/3-demethylubiquinone-9 3-methyltransferase